MISPFIKGHSNIYNTIWRSLNLASVYSTDSLVTSGSETNNLNFCSMQLDGSQSKVAEPD